MWRGRKSSPGSGPPSLAFPTGVSGVMSEACSVRYSGGAAPALHRFPWLPSAVQLCREPITGDDQEQAGRSAAASTHSGAARNRHDPPPWHRRDARSRRRARRSAGRALRSDPRGAEGSASRLIGTAGTRTVTTEPAATSCAWKRRNVRPSIVDGDTSVSPPPSMAPCWSSSRTSSSCVGCSTRKPAGNAFGGSAYVKARRLRPGATGANAATRPSTTRIASFELISGPLENSSKPAGIAPVHTGGPLSVVTRVSVVSLDRS